MHRDIPQNDVLMYSKNESWVLTKPGRLAAEDAESA